MDWNGIPTRGLQRRKYHAIPNVIRLVRFARELVAVIVLAGLMCGCGNAGDPPGTGLGSDLPDITAGTGVISSSTVGDLALLQTFSGHSRRVLDVAFYAGGEMIASSSQDMTIRLWDIGSGQEVHSFRMMSVDMADIDVTSDGRLLASGEAIWDVGELRELHVIERGTQIPAHVAFSPDGSTLAVGRFDQAIQLWDVASGDPVFSLAEQEENRSKRMEYSPDGALLAAGVIDGRVMLWDIGSGELAGIFWYSGETDIHDVAFSPDGAYLASGGRIPAVILWDVDRGEVVRTFGVRDTVLSVAFSPDGTILAAAAGSERAILLWDVESGNLLRSLRHDDQLSAIAFSRDGRYLVAGGFDSEVYLWGIPSDP